MEIFHPLLELGVKILAQETLFAFGIIDGRRATVMECQYGPRRKGCIAKKSNEYEDESGQLKKPHRPTCPARIYIKKVRKFPEYRIDPNLEGKNVRQAQERALTTLRLAGVEMGGEERFYVQLPLPIAHEYHDTDDVPMATLEDQGQRLNQQIISKIQEYVARGVTGLYAIKHLLKEFVEKEMFSGQEAPPKHNKAYFPTIIDIQNHMHQAQMALASGTLMALPPLTNLQIPNQHKDRPRKRRNHEKVTQTPQGLATVHAIASIQQHLDDSISEEEQKQESIKAVKDKGCHQFIAIIIVCETPVVQEQEDLEQQLNKIHPHNTGEHQILVTPSNGMHVQTKDGQVVIVVTSNSVFSSQQDSETPNTFALTALPASQINTLSHGTLGTLGAGGQTVLITHPGEHGQYLTQSDNILTVLNSGLATTDEGALLGIASKGVGTTAATRPSVPEQLLASQAAVAAVLNAAAASIGSDEDSKQADEEGKEPPAKRRAMATIDLSSLVKEAVVYDHSQGLHHLDYLILTKSLHCSCPHITVGYCP
ncbi:predicted protein [Nematostella vectensis]|uniref:Calcium-responsive transcription factor n=1 Tax=Nematostella vectensis TaxID=45351 RepID=A7S0X4_NEMVE|nr:predicted protein [Nematostella vectensis]|eukprot:XP_001634722.1 predicted protein [Nematostella vectensis]